ncbi:recombinase family protein [Brevibacillus borstelensis]|uniref:recombinase family protein n=1 Tax=Brevibacillus borstelensis TaxID=45462 RepID=UPI00287F814B|nr:recombinase family protein [Brevibacillus borstelensis]MED1874851.1 recombinase family protein [Brevibacillus borstelensis]WNF04315.1 recombinase family protein [Brevibacillus borstelensis]
MKQNMLTQYIEKNRTAIYVRVSTTKLSQKDSPEHQVGVCRERAKQENLVVQEHLIYEDRDTGTTITDRPAIQRLIKDAQNGAFDIVIFASLSRFARDTGDALNLKRKLVDALGIRLISIDEGYDSKKDLDELKFTIISAVNQKLSEQISYSSRRGKRQSALKGNFTGSIPPYGYKKQLVNDRKMLIPDEETKHIVQKIFQLYTANKMGEKAIVDYLNNQGIPSPKKGKWGITSIQRILQNEAYIGRNTFGKYESVKVFTNVNDTTERRKKQVQKDPSEWQRAHEPQTHQAIIDEETFLKAQEIRLERGGGQRGGIRNRINVFAGIIKCKHCGSSMVSMKCKNGKNSADGREYRYLICSRRRRQGDAGCLNDFWLPYYSFRDDLLKELSNRLRSITSAEQLLERFKNTIQVNTNDIDLEIKRLQKNIEENRKCILELRKEKMKGAFNDEEQYEFEKRHYEQEIQVWENRMNSLKQELQKKADLTQLYEEVMDSLDELLDLDYDNFDELHLTLKKLIASIEVDRDGQINVMTTFGIQLDELSADGNMEPAIAGSAK